MKKLNRNNADIEKLRDKKVAVRLVGVDAEIDFRKWLEENGIYFNNVKLLIREGIRTEICYCVEGNSWDWCDKNWFIEKGYSLYEWEIAEKEEKIYTIIDVVENEGNVYRTTTNNCIYKYDNTNLYYKAIRKLSDDWRKTELTLGEMIELKFIEYKPEPKEISFEEALKEMETKACRCLFSNRWITIHDSYFLDCSNGEDTNLSLSEITGKWEVFKENL